MRTNCFACFFFFFFFFFQEGSGACQHPNVYVCHLNLIEKLRFLKHSHADKFQCRNLKFSRLARYILKAKTAKFQVSN